MLKIYLNIIIQFYYMLNIVYTIFIHFIKLYIVLKEFILNTFFINILVRRETIYNLIYEYKMVHNGHYHSIYFINKNDFYKSLSMTNEEWNNLLLKKNKIIHCCITNEDFSEYLMDITDYIKNFVYYFDEDIYIDMKYMIPHNFSFKHENICIYVNTEKYEKKYIINRKLL